MLHRTNHVTPVDRLAKRGENKRLKEVQARHCKVWCNGLGSTRSKSGVHGKKVSPFWNLRCSLDPVEVEAERYVVASFGAGSGMSGRKSCLMLTESGSALLRNWENEAQVHPASAPCACARLVLWHIHSLKI